LSSPLRTAVLGFLLAALLVYVLTPLMSRIARRTGAVDNPSDERRMHVLPTPLLGGLGMYLGWLVPVIVLVPIDRPVWGIIGGVTIVVAVGLFDDLYELEPIVKFVGQLLAIGVAIYFGIRVDSVAVPFTAHLVHFPLPLSVLVTAFWMATIVNMVNFIDGLDGLAAGVCGISSLTFCVVSLSTGFPPMGIIAAVLAGATFAFLRFNFHPASIFMGDAGSMLLGFTLASISVQSVMKGSAAVSLVLPLLMLAVPFVDLFLIVWRRWRRGVPFYAAGQDHVHHDLVLVHGFSQRKSVLLLYTWCLLLSGLGIALQRGNKLAILVLGVAAAVATAYMARLLSRYRARSLDLEPVTAGVPGGTQPEPAGAAAAAPNVPANGNGQAPPAGAATPDAAAEQPRGAGERRA
jgi:UDP-GlcNAc:undecaprenyl-phosphate/decaprenyl-phosphate GlcNAc-1-phosphate transferase